MYFQGSPTPQIPLGGECDTKLCRDPTGVTYQGIKNRSNAKENSLEFSGFENDNISAPEAFQAPPEAPKRPPGSPQNVPNGPPMDEKVHFEGRRVATSHGSDFGNFSVISQNFPTQVEHDFCEVGCPHDGQGTPSRTKEGLTVPQGGSRNPHESSKRAPKGSENDTNVTPSGPPVDQKIHFGERHLATGRGIDFGNISAMGQNFPMSFELDFSEPGTPHDGQGTPSRMKSGSRTPQDGSESPHEFPEQGPQGPENSIPTSISENFGVQNISVIPRVLKSAENPHVSGQGVSRTPYGSPKKAKNDSEVALVGPPVDQKIHFGGRQSARSGPQALENFSEANRNFSQGDELKTPKDWDPQLISGPLPRPEKESENPQPSPIQNSETAEKSVFTRNFVDGTMAGVVCAQKGPKSPKSKEFDGPKAPRDPFLGSQGYQDDGFTPLHGQKLGSRDLISGPNVAKEIRQGIFHSENPPRDMKSPDWSRESMGMAIFPPPPILLGKRGFCPKEKS